MTDDLALRAQQLTPNAWNSIVAVAASVNKPLDSGNEAELITKMIVAYETGIPLHTAWKNVYIIKGQPVVAPKIIHGLVMRHPQFAGYTENELLDDNGNHHGWEITLFRMNPYQEEGISATRRFTLEDAAKAGLIKPDSAWKKYPRNMTYWRTIGHVEDALFPDAVFGFLRADWAGAPVNDSGEVIEGEWVIPFDLQKEMSKLFDTYGRSFISEMQGNDPDPANEEDFEAFAAMVKEAHEAESAAD